MNPGDKVRYLTCKDEISKEVCEVIDEFTEDGIKCFRIKKPNDEIMRIYHDRVVSQDAEKKVEKKDDKDEDKKDVGKLDWSTLKENLKTLKITANSEIWVSNNSFNHDGINCITVAVLDKTYRTANIYFANGMFTKVSGMMEYKNDISKVRAKLAKKGYKMECCA